MKVIELTTKQEYKAEFLPTSKTEDDFLSIEFTMLSFEEYAKIREWVTELRDIKRMSLFQRIFKWKY